MAFPFYDLPGEIRNQTLRLLLTHRTPIITRFANQLSPPEPTALNLCPNILLASWRTYHEGIRILYGENTFQAHPSYLTSVLFAIDPSQTVTSKICIAYIRRFHIRVRLDCDPFYKPEAVKEVFQGAEELEVEVFRSAWAIGGYGALEGFAALRNIEKAKVHGSVGVEFAKWLEGVMETHEGTEVGERIGDQDFGWVGLTKVGDAWNHDR